MNLLGPEGSAKSRTMSRSRGGIVDGWAQSDDQLQRGPEDLFVSRLLRHAQGLQRSLRAGEQRFGEDPRSGALYVFCNRRHTRIKVLYFDGTGLWVLSKRLERGTLSWPKPAQADSPKLKLTPEAFAMLTDGVDLRGAKMRPRYGRE
jgi:transposase